MVYLHPFVKMIRRSRGRIIPVQTQERLRFRETENNEKAMPIFYTNSQMIAVL